MALKIRLNNVPVRDQEQVLQFYCGTLGFEKKLDIPLGVEFTGEPVDAGGTMIAVLDDTCGNFIQLYEAG